MCRTGLAADETAPVQVAALLATVDCGLPWTTDAVTRVSALVPLERHGFGLLWVAAGRRAVLVPAVPDGRECAV